METNDYADFMFKVPILHLSVRNWQTKKRLLLDLIDNDSMDVQYDEHVNSDYHAQLNTPLEGRHNEAVNRILNEEINLFCGHYGFIYYKIVMSWFETASKGNYHGIHNHGSTGYSSVCYIDYDKESHTPTQFLGPFNNFITGSSLHYTPKVHEGSIIFFPSVILHYTDPNPNDIKRTILSFNIDVKETHDQRPRNS